MQNLRICTCPKRDFENDEKNREKQLSKNILLDGVGKEKITHPGKRKAYWVLVSLTFFLKFHKMDYINRIFSNNDINLHLK